MKKRRGRLRKISGKRRSQKLFTKSTKKTNKAYRDRIIERNRKAREQQEKEQAANRKVLTKDETPKKEDKAKAKTKKHKSEQKKEDFDDIMKGDENPQRVQNYSAGPKATPTSRKARYADVEDVKIEMGESDTKQKLNFDPIKENSEESKESKKEEVNKNFQATLEKDGSSKGMIEDFNDREDDSGEKQESDINDRADWKMDDEVKGHQKATSSTHINKPFKEDEADSSRKINNGFKPLEKKDSFGMDQASDHI